MPIGSISGKSPPPNRVSNPYEVSVLVRAWYLTDKYGIEHRMETQEDLQKILDQMTPEELEKWRINLKFQLQIHCIFLFTIFSKSL